MNKDLNIDSMVGEYKKMLAEMDSAGDAAAPPESIAQALVEQHEWSEGGAAALVALAQDYGTFMLRNALALAEALEIEDGALGF